MSRLLYIGNRTYSSWSLRGWLACKLAGEPFEVVLVPFDTPAFDAAKTDGRWPGGTVPTLHDGDCIVWESTAIIDHLAEAHPARFWPQQAKARALARSASAQMHAGFGALRSACPMNLRRRWRDYPLSDPLRTDLARLDALWAACRAQATDEGPYLFGGFGAADAMYAPVATRIDSYDLPVSAASRAYCNAVIAHPWMQDWTALARTESQIVPIDEVDVPAAETLW